MRDHASQGVSRSGHHTSQGVSCCDHHTSQGTISGGHHTSQGVSSCGLSDLVTSHGLYCDHPDDRWSKRQQDLLDQRLLEETGSDDDWQYHKDTYSESQETIASVEDPNTIGGGGQPPPPPRPLPPVPPPPARILPPHGEMHACEWHTDAYVRPCLKRLPSKALVRP